MRTVLIGMAGLCLAVAVVAFAHAGDDWDTVESDEYGIRFAVPDEDKCSATERDGVIGLYCEGPLQIVMIAYTGDVSLKEMRPVAQQYTEIDEKYWKLQGKTSNENGYKRAEAWTAEGDGHAAAVLLGNSGKRAVSHIVFIVGKVDAWKKHEKEVSRFIDNIHAI